MADLETQIRDYLRMHPEVREVLELVRMTEEEYVRALIAYEVPTLELPTVGSTRTATRDVNVSATSRQPVTAS